MIDEAAIKKLSKLAKLSIAEAELPQYRDQLQKIMQHFEQISQIETVNVEPLITPIPLEIHLRKDEIIQEVTVQEILQNAPDKSGNLFKVPPVI